MANRWWNYVVRVAGTDKQTQIERVTGINQSNLSRWKAGADPTPKHVRSIAEAFSRPVTEAFVEAGFLTPDEVGSAPHLVADLSTVTHSRLVAEVERRLGRADQLTGDSQWLAAVDAAADLTPAQHDRIRQYMGAGAVAEELAKEERLVVRMMTESAEVREEDYEAAERFMRRWPARSLAVFESFKPEELARFLISPLPPRSAIERIADEREAADLGVTLEAFHDLWGGDIVKLRQAVLGGDALIGDGLPGLVDVSPEEWAKERVHDEAHEDLAAHDEDHTIESEQGHDEHP